jgi:hypothetical protein
MNLIRESIWFCWRRWQCSTLYSSSRNSKLRQATHLKKTIYWWYERLWASWATAVKMFCICQVLLANASGFIQIYIWNTQLQRKKFIGFVISATVKNTQYYSYRIHLFTMAHQYTLRRRRAHLRVFCNVLGCSYIHHTAFWCKAAVGPAIQNL